MISVIICSVNPALAESLEMNVRETIGVEHEIILFDNRKLNWGIARVYNDCAARAIFPILCFMHEDIALETMDWGVKVVVHLSDSKLGMIGLAGGDTKSRVPSSWSSSVFESEISLIQHFRNDSKPPLKIVKTGYPEDKSLLKPVCCIDGVWMCTRKDVMDHISFDAMTCPSFHGYDIDFSLQVFSVYRVGVVFDILVRHFSDGRFEREWLQSCIRISDKWRSKLPLSVRNLSAKEFTRQHWTSMNVLIDKMLELNYGRVYMGFQIMKYGFGRYFHGAHFVHSCRKIIFKIRG